MCMHTDVLTARQIDQFTAPARHARLVNMAFACGVPIGTSVRVTEMQWLRGRGENCETVRRALIRAIKLERLVMLGAPALCIPRIASTPWRTVRALPAYIALIDQKEVA